MRFKLEFVFAGIWEIWKNTYSFSEADLPTIRWETARITGDDLEKAAEKKDRFDSLLALYLPIELVNIILGYLNKDYFCRVFLTDEYDELMTIRNIQKYLPNKLKTFEFKEVKRSSVPLTIPIQIINNLTKRLVTTEEIKDPGILQVFDFMIKSHLRHLIDDTFYLIPKFREYRCIKATRIDQ